MTALCSGLTTLAPAPSSLPTAATLTQFRSVCSVSLNSLAAAPAISPSLTHVTASSLNSAVSSCFETFIISPFMVNDYTSPVENTIRGSSNHPRVSEDIYRRLMNRAG